MINLYRIGQPIWKTDENSWKDCKRIVQTILSWSSLTLRRIYFIVGICILLHGEYKQQPMSELAKYWIIIFLVLFPLSCLFYRMRPSWKVDYWATRNLLYSSMIRRSSIVSSRFRLNSTFCLLIIAFHLIPSVQRLSTLKHIYPILNCFRTDPRFRWISGYCGAVISDTRF